MKLTVHTYNAFTKESGGGNPAGVVLNSDHLTDCQMLKISAKVGFSETAFIQKSDKADFKMRYFTPEDEVNICGHATIASFALLMDENIINPGLFSLETKAGVLKIEVNSDGLIMMQQNKPVFLEALDKEMVAKSLNISTNNLSPNLPVQIVSTGLRDILVTVAKLDELLKLKPDFKSVAEISKKYGVIGYHLFSLETKDNAAAHCRNFAPLYGIPEESATGTSNAALACYLYNYGLIDSQQTNHLIFEQGYCMNRPSEIVVRLKCIDDKINQVFVGGKAIKTILLELEVSNDSSQR